MFVNNGALNTSKCYSYAASNVLMNLQRNLNMKKLNHPFMKEGKG